MGSEAAWIDQLTSLPCVVFVVAAVLLVAFRTNRFAPKKRRFIRDTAVAALLYLVSFGVSWGFGVLGVPGAATVACEFAAFFGLLASINLGVLVVFNLGLSSLHVTAAPFLASLMV